ncbi:MAG: hypothetical protein GTO40_21065 [Deltaproteobacteria bacterium]|nr:hypothetical protein [Deltaproteobacteria bacterium]
MTLSLVMALALTSSLGFAAGYANSNLLVETDQLAKLINDSNVRIVDVRDRAAYRKGHIPTPFTSATTTS